MQSGEFTGEILTLQCQTKMWGPICEPNRTVRKYLPPVQPTTLVSTSARLWVSCLSCSALGTGTRPNWNHKSDRDTKCIMMTKWRRDDDDETYQQWHLSSLWKHSHTKWRVLWPKVKVKLWRKAHCSSGLAVKKANYNHAGYNDFSGSRSPPKKQKKIWTYVGRKQTMPQDIGIWPRLRPGGRGVSWLNSFLGAE